MDSLVWQVEGVRANLRSSRHPRLADCQSRPDDCDATCEERCTL